MIKIKYDELNQLDLRQFHLRTSPDYEVLNCQILTLDCKDYWETVQAGFRHETVYIKCDMKFCVVSHCHRYITCQPLVQTSRGSCLILKPQKLYQMEKDKESHRKNQAFEAKSGGSLLQVLSDVDRVPPPSKFKQIDFTVGFNESDGTFGWNGFNNGLELFFMDTDEKYPSLEHKVSLVPGLNPTIVFSSETTQFLGEPFTSKTCVIFFTELI